MGHNDGASTKKNQKSKRKQNKQIVFETINKRKQKTVKTYILCVTKGVFEREREIEVLLFHETRSKCLYPQKELSIDRMKSSIPLFLQRFFFLRQHAKVEKMGEIEIDRYRDR